MYFGMINLDWYQALIICIGAVQDKLEALAAFPQLKALDLTGRRFGQFIYKMDQARIFIPR